MIQQKPLQTFTLSCLTTEFQKQSGDVQRQMMSKLVKRVIVNNLSPHLFYLYIIWQDGVATRPDVALLWRGQPLTDKEEWSEKDNDFIRSYWPKGQQEEIWPWSVEVVGFSGLTRDEDTSSRLSEHGWSETRTDGSVGWER